MVLSNYIWIKWLELWHISDAVFKFAKTAQDTSTVSFFVVVGVQAHAEFDGEPVDGGESHQL